jgi:hypothetical protein
MWNENQEPLEITFKGSYLTFNTLDLANKDRFSWTERLPLRMGG